MKPFIPSEATSSLSLKKFATKFYLLALLASLVACDDPAASSKARPVAETVASGQDTEIKENTEYAEAGLTEDELAIPSELDADETASVNKEPAVWPEAWPEAWPEELPAAVEARDAKLPLKLEIYSEGGYKNSDGQLVLDVLEREYLYLAVMVEDATGAPVNGVTPIVSTSGSSKVAKMSNKSGDDDAVGNFAFGVVGGVMGEETLTVQLGSAKTTALLNIIDLKAAGYRSLSDIDGVLGWDHLMRAKVKWGEKLSASFPPAVQERNGKTVKLAGFMMPIEMTPQQSRFILTSNPPNCYFHIPGGPAGAVEVRAAKPIEVSWEPIVLEGRFEALASNSEGTVYRLHDAQIAKE